MMRHATVMTLNSDQPGKYYAGSGAKNPSDCDDCPIGYVSFLVSSCWVLFWDFRLAGEYYIKNAGGESCINKQCASPKAFSLCRNMAVRMLNIVYDQVL